MIQPLHLRLLPILLLLLPKVFFAQNLTVSGYIYDHQNGETLVGVTVQAMEAGTGTSSNEYGFYTISLPPGKYQLRFSYVGFETVEKSIDLQKANKDLNLRMGENENILQGVEISATRQKLEEHVKSTDMGRLSVPIEVLKRTPVLFGEADIVKAVQLLPGVKRGGEGSVGMYVRGGSNDENLILLDEATVYQIGHALGFLSVFNTNAIKSVDLYKGAFPSQYGGRLSSVMDVRMRDGNDQKFGVQANIGNIASNLTVEGPLVKGRSSFILSGRRSYIDRLVNLVQPGLLPYYFYDFNAKVNYKLNDRDRLYLSSYIGRDVLSASSDAVTDTAETELGLGTNIGNLTLTARWNHIYRNQKLFHNLTLIRSQFRYRIEGQFAENSVLIRSSIDDIGLKLDYDFRPNTRTSFKFGTNIIDHRFKPNLISVQGDISDDLRGKASSNIASQEAAVYGSVDRDLGARWKMNGGLRFSSTFVEGVAYANLEPRIGARYALSEQHSFKLGYARMAQYLHLVSSSTVALPTDLWYPSTKNVLPGTSDQISAGYFTYFGEKNAVQFSVETYYKWLQGLIEYRPGARLILNDDYEKELVRGKGRAYGVEFLLQKNTGKLNGWIGYTLSYATRTFAELNNGQPYYAKYDRRHDVSVVTNYDFTKRFGVSVVWVYSSGSPFTPLVAKYVQPLPNYSGIELLPVYPLRNSYRLNDAHRLDIDFILRGKIRKRFNSEWHLGAYNVYNRVQPNRVALTVDPATGREKYQERGLFGIIGSLSYHLKF
jgi:CarboxypepD_reg-like domain/TonB-dependent Receptor Plug Domain